MSKEKIRILFEQKGDDLVFVEVEDEHGDSIDVGNWVEDEEFKVLEMDVL